MTDRNHNRPTDRELEEALAFAARLKSAHKDEGNTAPPEDPALTKPAQEEAPVPVAESPQAPVVETPASAETEQPEEEIPAQELPVEEEAAPKKNSFIRVLCRVIPVAGDPWWEVGRKLLFLVALVVLIGSVAMLINESFIIPQENAALRQELTQIFTDPRASELTTEEAAFEGYPEGLENPGLKKLYYLNNDVRGWLKYESCGVNEWVMYSPDQSYYLTHDFYRNSNKNGSLFFDSANNLSTAAAHYKSLVIYGHNMASGQMFAGLNALAGSVDTMKRAGSIVQLETLFDTYQYKIFAVVVQDSKSKIEHYYSIQATSFSSNQQFMEYVEGLRARSLYDFNGVDVVESDDILIMYTCSPKSVAGFDDARLGVIARRVRPGESATVNASTITVNKDVIMPYAWYTANKKTPHEYYKTGILPASTVTTTTGKDTATTTSGDDDETTTTTSSAKPSTGGNSGNSGGGKKTTTAPKSTTSTTASKNSGGSTTPPTKTTADTPNNTTVPPKGTTTPTDGTTAPTDGTTAPTEDTAAPTEDTAAPTEDTAAPTEDTAAPTEDTAAPTEATAAPTEDTAAPTEDTAAPTEDTAAPTEATAAPTEAAASEA